MRSPNAEANADFIHESYSVYHETKLTPRELVERSQKLVESLKNTLSALKSMIGQLNGEWIEVKEAEKILNNEKS